MKIVTQVFHCSAVKPENDFAILNGSQPKHDGTFDASTLFWTCCKSAWVNTKNSSQISIIRLAVPR